MPSSRAMVMFGGFGEPGSTQVQTDFNTITITVDAGTWVGTPAGGWRRLLLPSPPGLVESEVGVRRESRYRSMFTTMRTSEPWPAAAARVVLVLGFALVGSRAYWRGRSTSAHPLFLAALASLAWNALVHAFFLYADLFLYSKHWELPLLVLVGGCALQEAPVAVALAGFTAATAVNNAVILRGLLRSLEALFG